MQKTAYEMRISDWSSDVCSSDLLFGLSGRCDAGRSHEFYEIEHGLRIRPVNDRAPLSIKYYDSRGRQSPEMVAERALLNTEPAGYFTRGDRKSTRLNSSH